MARSPHIYVPRERLINARREKQLSQQELGKFLGTNGVAISRWESGKMGPSPHFRRLLCTFFERSEAQLDLVSSEVQRFDPSIPQMETIVVGREKSLQQIKDVLRIKTDVAVYGLPGIGKTTLAVALIADLSRKYERVLWVNLGSHPHLLHVLAEIARNLDILMDGNQLSVEEIWRTLRRVIGSRRFLIVIDDAWTFEDAFSIKRLSSQCSFVLTTRFPEIALQFAGEQAILLPELEEQESMQLLSSFAPSIQEYELNSLVQAVGGLPLALTLMGNYLRLLSLRNNPRRINDALKELQRPEERFSLSQLSLEFPPKKISLQTILDEIYSRLSLSRDNLVALETLAFFPTKPNSVSEYVLLSIGCSRKALDALYTSGLVEVQLDRYRLHQVVADYVLSVLSKEQHYEVVSIIRYYTQFLQDHQQDYALLEQEHMNIFRVLDKTRLHEGHSKAVSAFTPYLIAKGFYTQAEEYLRSEFEENADRLHLLGQIAQKRGEYEHAEELYQKALSLATESRHAILADLGWTYLKRGKYEQAHTVLLAALSLAQSDDWQRCKIIRLLGSVSCSLGDFQKGIEFLQEALVLARLVHDSEQICILLINLGGTRPSPISDAILEDYLLEAAQIAQAIWHGEWKSLAYMNLSDLYLEQGKYKLVEQYAHEGLQLAQQIGNPEWIAGNIANLAIAAREQKRYDQAIKLFEEAIELVRLGRPDFTAMFLYEYAILWCDLHQCAKAQALLDEMKEHIPEGDTALLHYFQHGRSRLEEEMLSESTISSKEERTQSIIETV